MSRPVPRRVRFDQPPRGRPPYDAPRYRGDAYDAPRHEPPQYESNRSRTTRQDEYDTAGYFVPGGEGQGGRGAQAGYRPQAGYGAPAGYGAQAGHGAPAGYDAPAGYRARRGGSTVPQHDDATRFDMPGRYDDPTRYEVPVHGNGGWRDDAPTLLNGAPYDPAGPRGPRPGRRPLDGAQGPKTRKHRIRRLWRLRTVKVATALVAVFALWLSISVGQALATPNGESMSSKLAEWARDHYLGPVVTFGEWLTYKAPPVGGKPSFSLTQGESKTKFKHVRGFTPIIPANLASPAGNPLAGEGVWRVAETVKGQPAMFTTFLRNDAVHTAEVSGIVSMDQRLLSFSLHPGSQDPGAGNWHALPDIPAGKRAGLMATFNGGFRLNVSGGGFYLNGATSGNLTNGAASLVYYKDGTVKIGVWGRDVGMTPNVAGVRQNLKLIIDHGQVPSAVNQNVLSSWGATIGGAYYVWRSGIGITKDGRVIYVYGPALSVKTLAGLLQRAGAVEAMQMDINPFWMSFESYHGKTSDPTPKALLPDQPTSAYRYYSVYSRDFTSVYSR